MPILGYGPNKDITSRYCNAKVHELNPSGKVTIPDVKTVNDVATNIVNVQNQQDSDVLKAESAQQNEYANYQLINTPYVYSDKKKNLFKFWSNSTIILTSPLDINTIFYTRIYQKISDESFSQALITGNWKNCATILVQAFVEARILQIVSPNLNEITEFVSEVLKSISTKLGFFIGVDSAIFQAIAPKIIGGGIATLFFISFLDSDDNIQLYGAVANAFICFSLNWIWAVPLSAIVGKSVEVWSSLKNEDNCKRSTYWKIGQTLEHTIRELPIVSGIFWFFKYNVRLPLLTKNEIVDVDNVPEVFCCTISLEKMIDPVFVHGTVFERKIILKWLEKSDKHPMTRNYVNKYQLVKPPTEYMEAFNNFTKRYEAELAKKNKEQKKNDNKKKI